MLLPPTFAHGASFGVAVHFVLSAGFAKLDVGGLSWGAPATMRFYLDVYRSSRSAPPFPAASPRGWSARAWATAAAGQGTLVVELLAVPATLFLPSEWRWLGWALMLALHAGIAVCMSARVGIGESTSHVAQ